MAFLRTQLMQTCRKRIWANHTFPSTATVVPTNTTMYAPTSTDGPMVFEFHQGLTIEEGALFTPAARCKGMCLVVKGDLIVDGTLSMSARGAAAAGDDLALDYVNGAVLLNPSNIDEFEYTIGAAGGSGGARTTVKSGSNSGSVYRVHGQAGSASTTGGCGGGGAGGGVATYTGRVYTGPGAAATSYSGGAGGGGVSIGKTTTLYGYGGSGNGGKGGNGRYSTSTGTRGATGGAGNPAGSPYKHGSITCYSSSSGAGGLLIVMVAGDIIVGESGVIKSDGSKSGNIAGGYPGFGAHGGASGGGSINMFHTGAFVNNGTVQANGGATGTGGASRGGAGGAGTVRVAKVVL